MKPQTAEKLRSAREALLFALEKYPERLDVVMLEDLLMDTARENSRRSAYAKISLSDEIVKSLRGSADKQKDVLLLVSIPKEVRERSESSIILPGEV